VTRAQYEVRIGRPIEQVFDFLADGSNNPRWQPRTQLTSQVETALAAGTSFRQTMRHPFGFNISSNYKLTVFERPHTLVLVATSRSPIRPTVTYDLTEHPGGGTVLHCTVEYRPIGMARFAAPLLSIVRPLVAWEASWIEGVRDVLESLHETS
jgi:uncharacterized protein YndB with AHSA1/START domain